MEDNQNIDDGELLSLPVEELIKLKKKLVNRLNRKQVNGSKDDTETLSTREKEIESQSVVNLLDEGEEESKCCVIDDAGSMKETLSTMKHHPMKSCKRHANDDNTEVQEKKRKLDDSKVNQEENSKMDESPDVYGTRKLDQSNTEALTSMQENCSNETNEKLTCSSNSGVEKEALLDSSSFDKDRSATNEKQALTSQGSSSTLSEELEEIDRANHTVIRSEFTENLENSVEQTWKEDEELKSDYENVDDLLEKSYGDEQPGKVPLPENGEIREKVVLAYHEADHFDVLPAGWMQLTHSSGLPIYLETTTRVCTFGRPYFIGPASTRNHSVPYSAIPCLNHKRILKEREESEALAAEEVNKVDLNSTEKDTGDLGQQLVVAIAKLQTPGTKVQTLNDFKKKHLAPNDLHDYAKKLFHFKTIKIRRFNKWADTRNYHRQKKLAEAERLGKLAPSIELPVSRPTLPPNVKLITVPSMEANMKPQHKGFFLNPAGKTSVSILHEYVQKILKTNIGYHFADTRSSSTPYCCSAKMKLNLNSRVMCAPTVKEKISLLVEKQKREQQLRENGEELNDLVIGTGYGNSKKTAKADAARRALKILIPEVEFDDDCIAISGKKDEKQENDLDIEKEEAIDFFDMLPIEDPRIPELSARAGQLSPYLLLQECLKRNAAYGDTEIKLSSFRIKHQKHQFDMDVGKHRVTVICSNKREGKQKASQAMLKKLHPEHEKWGALLRIYDHEMQQKQDAKRNRQSIIQLQNIRDKERSSLEPNMAILDKLRKEMVKLTKVSKSVCTEQLRPKISKTFDPADPEKIAKESTVYAKSHPDSASYSRINL